LTQFFEWALNLNAESAAFLMLGLSQACYNLLYYIKFDKIFAKLFFLSPDISSFYRKKIKKSANKQQPNFVMFSKENVPAPQSKKKVLKIQLKPITTRSIVIMKQS